MFVEPRNVLCIHHLAGLEFHRSLFLMGYLGKRLTEKTTTNDDIYQEWKVVTGRKQHYLKRCPRTSAAKKCTCLANHKHMC